MENVDHGHYRRETHRAALLAGSAAAWSTSGAPVICRERFTATGYRLTFTLVLVGAMKQTAYRFVPEVEALRGIAALSVVFEHTVGDTRGFSSLFHIIFNGQAAVILFFVMSGFALANQIKNQPLTPASYAAFVIRRLFRLMPIVWLGLILALIVSHATTHQPLGSADDREVISDALLLRFHFNPPYWTLCVELWCSFAFPVLFFLWGRATTPTRLMLVAALAAPTLLLPATSASLGLEWSRYLICFALGLSAAEYRGALQRLPAPALAMITVACLLVGGSVDRWTDQASVVLLVRALSYCLLLAIVLLGADRHAQTLLQWRTAKFVGMISFGIYALHGDVLGATRSFTLHNFEWPTNAQPAHFIATVAITIPLAYFSFRFVERPLNSIGRSIAERITQLRSSKFLVFGLPRKPTAQDG